MKQICKRLTAVLLAVILVVGLVPLQASAADGVVIKLHYNRPDGDYTDWSVWFWNYGQEGVDIPFADENGEKVATYQVDPGVTKVGFIVKLPNWAAKDVNEDQFIDVAAYTAGTVHVYVESGVRGYTTVLGDDIESGIKVTSVVYKEDQGFVVKTTAAVGDAAEVFTLSGPEGPLTFAAVTGSDTEYVIVTEEEIDLYGAYTLTYMGESYDVNMPNVYSTAAFEDAYTYTGNDLGATWSAEKTAWRLWAPTADRVTVNLYESGTPGTDDLLEQIEMTPDINGTWTAEKEGNLNGVYYTYTVTLGDVANEACDPYARATGVNGQRAMVINLDSTDPAGWETDSDPHAGNAITDAVIYELHIRDLSMDESSGITNKGKYLGLIETGTVNSQGISTGLDHIKNLGITHLHLLPCYDYGSVDETRLDTPQFNWGYDPVNYNVPEGSYSTDPYNGAVRVGEFKQMVQGLHNNGISVIMDVVYNHVYSADQFCFNRIVPGYFSRISDSGSYSNGSGCGNDTASERSMVRKYIVDSVLYWVEEYHIDGFRFDLVGLIDTETINAVIEAVHATHPNVIFYGEGWTMTTQVTKEGYTMTTQPNSTLVPGFSFFNDTLRDALKGSVFSETDDGYVSGAAGQALFVQQAFLGAVSWCKSPTQTINYASCHDNLSLYDKLILSTPGATTEDRIRMNNLAAAIYMLSQGTPFFQAGEEMLRSKPLGDGKYDHNSYASSDEVNSIKWDSLNEESHQQVCNYYRGLIAFRRAHSALRLTSAEEVAASVTKVTGLETNVTGFHIAAGAGGEENDLFIIFNPGTEATAVTLPQGDWEIYIQGSTAGTEVLGTVTGEVQVEPISALVLVKAPAAEAPAEDPTAESTAPQEPGDPSIGIIGGADGPTAIFVTGSWTGVIIALVLAVAIAAAAIVLLRKRKK